MRYSDFLADARETGWRFRFLRTNTFLRNGALRRLNGAVCAVPRMRDYFIHNVYAVMERAAQANAANDAAHAPHGGHKLAA
jgi:hypothetical protein